MGKKTKKREKKKEENEQKNEKKEISVLRIERERGGHYDRQFDLLYAIFRTFVFPQIQLIRLLDREYSFDCYERMERERERENKGNIKKEYNNNIIAEEREENEEERKGSFDRRIETRSMNEIRIADG